MQGELRAIEPLNSWDQVMNACIPIKSTSGQWVVFSMSSQLGFVHFKPIGQSSRIFTLKRRRTWFWTTHLMYIPLKLSPNTLSTCCKSNHQHALPHLTCQWSSLVNVN